MKKRMIIMSISLLVIFGGIIAFNVIKSILTARFLAHYQPPAVTVSSSTAEAVDWQPMISAVGNFVAINGVEVSAEASGTVTNIDFDSGEYVIKNAPLITIDDSVDQAMLQFNQSELALKQLNYKRQTDLFQRGATPISSVDEAKANLQQAQAKVEQIQAQINHKHITAPFSGRLGIRQINLGQYIIPGQTSIVSLQSMDPLYLEFYLPEQFNKRIHLHQPILFSVEEYPHALFKGFISAINSKIDLNTHNILIQATLANCPLIALKDLKNTSLVTIDKEAKGNKFIVTCNSESNSKNHIKDFIFIPGMFSLIQISQPIEPGTIVVPSTAISYSLYGNAVYLIKKNNTLLTAQRVFVTTGAQQGNYTVIKKGIKAGDVVVSTGDLKLQNETPVIINNSIQLNNETNTDTLEQ